jgi:mannose-6-phosphate isomerase-like protein (cupin superfamily)
VSEPSKVSVVGPGGGEPIRLGPVRMRILQDGRTTGHRLAITESVLRPYTLSLPQHRHARHDEGFHIVSGTAVFTVGDTDYEAPTGTLVVVRPARRTVRQSRRRACRHDQHLRLRSVWSVLQRHERTVQGRRVDTAYSDRGGAPIRHPARDRARVRLPAARTSFPGTVAGNVSTGVRSSARRRAAAGRSQKQRSASTSRSGSPRSRRQAERGQVARRQVTARS